MKPYYQDSAVTLYHGDCREIVPTLGRFDLCVTDPPYGVDLEYLSYDDSESNWFDLVGDIIPKLRSACDMVIMPSCQIKRLGWFYKNHNPDWLIAWHKGSPGHVSAVGFNDWEPLVVWGRTKGLSMHDHLSIVNNEKMGAYGHPSPKPLRWATWLIARACPDGGSVLEPFCGSGTTGVAAKELGRKCTMIEIEEKYAEIAAKRMSQEVFDLKPALNHNQTER